MAVIKKDIERGTSLTKGIEVFQPTRATRVFHATKLKKKGRERLDEAIDAFLVGEPSIDSNKEDYIHPDFTENNDLPLSSISTIHFGDDVWGSANYRRSIITAPRFRAFSQAVERFYKAGRNTERVYSTTEWQAKSCDCLIGVGTNSDVNTCCPGPFDIGWHEFFTDIRKERLRNEITVRTILDEHPADKILKVMKSRGLTPIQVGNALTVHDLYGSVNNAPFTINGFPRPCGSLKFDGISIRPISALKRLKYLVEYTFLEDPITWFGRVFLSSTFQCGAVEPIGGGTNKPVNCGTGASDLVFLFKTLVFRESIELNGFTYAATYPIVDFNDVFPTHDSPDGYDGSSHSTGVGRVSIFPVFPG